MYCCYQHPKTCLSFYCCYQHPKICLSFSSPWVLNIRSKTSIPCLLIYWRGALIKHCLHNSVWLLQSFSFPQRENFWGPSSPSPLFQQQMNFALTKVISASQDIVKIHGQRLRQHSLRIFRVIKIQRGLGSWCSRFFEKLGIINYHHNLLSFPDYIIQFWMIRNIGSEI